MGAWRISLCRHWAYTHIACDWNYRTNFRVYQEELMGFMIVVHRS